MTEQAIDRATKREYWDEILREFEESGMSGAAFCREKDLAYQTFGYWKKRLRPKNKEASGPVRFHELRLSGEACSGSYFELRLGAVTLRVPPRFDEADLQRILSVVVQSC